MYTRIRDLYHQKLRDTIPASKDSIILEEAKVLKAIGVHRRFKAMGSEMGRYPNQVKNRHMIIEKSLRMCSPEVLSIKEGISKLVDENVDSLTSLDAIPYDSFAATLGCSREALEKYWKEGGKQRYVRSKFPRWTLEDKDLLMAKVGESGEDDDKCVDFKKMFEENFRGKCADWLHLRVRFIEIRRTVPFFMLDDLQSVVTAARKDLENKLKNRAAGAEEEDDEEEEEDD